MANNRGEVVLPLTKVSPSIRPRRGGLIPRDRGVFSQTEFGEI